MGMIKEFPHYSDASDRENIKYILAKYGYEGETFWWHIMEKLNQNDSEPIDMNDPLTLFSVCKYIHPLEHDSEKREKTVLLFLDFCAKFKGTDGGTLIDPDLWAEKKIWNAKNSANQKKVLKRRKNQKRTPVPPEVTEFTKQMHHDIVNVFGFRKRVKWAYTWDDNLMKLLSDDVTLDDAKFVWMWLIDGKDPQALWWRKQIHTPNAFLKHFDKLYQKAFVFKPKVQPRGIFSMPDGK